MRIKRRFAALLLGVLALAPQTAGAQATNPSLRDLTQLVTSERLRTYALARGLAAGGPDLGTALDLKQLLRRQGFYMDETGWQRLAADQALYPQLSYVPNMNGGSPQESLEFRGLTFDLRDDLVARGGLAVGADWARISAIIIASISIIAQFLWLPYYPLWAILIIALDLVVIWAVATWKPSNIA